MPFPYRGETKELNETTRKEAAGSFIQLSDGVTHYELGSPPYPSPPTPFDSPSTALRQAQGGSSGWQLRAAPLPQGERGMAWQETGKLAEQIGELSNPVVLIHGFSVPYFIFDPTFEALTKAGLRVLRYDLFGRGWSDRPRAKYDINLFVKQLEDLLDALQFQQVNLIGLSMGGPIAASFTARYPERVDKLVMIDPAGARPIDLSVLLKAAKLPVVGELALGRFGSENMVKSIAADFFDPALVAEFQSKYKVQMQFKGFKNAILSTMRNGMLGSFIEIYQRAGKLNTPILIIWGRNDNTAPFSHSRDICRTIPQADLRVIEDCGHIPHYEKPDIVNTILLQFLI